MYKIIVFCVLFLLSFCRIGAMEKQCADACSLKNFSGEFCRRNAQVIEEIMEEQLDFVLLATNNQGIEDSKKQLMKNSGKLELILELDLVSPQEKPDVRTMLTCSQYMLQNAQQKNVTPSSESRAVTRLHSLIKTQSKTIQELQQEKKELLFIIHELCTQLKEKNKTMDHVLQEMERY